MNNNGVESLSLSEVVDKHSVLGAVQTSSVKEDSVAFSDMPSTIQARIFKYLFNSKSISDCANFAQTSRDFAKVAREHREYNVRASFKSNKLDIFSNKAFFDAMMSSSVPIAEIPALVKQRACAIETFWKEFHRIAYDPKTTYMVSVCMILNLILKQDSYTIIDLLSNKKVQTFFESKHDLKMTFIAAYIENNMNIDLSRFITLDHFTSSGIYAFVEKLESPHYYGYETKGAKNVHMFCAHTHLLSRYPIAQFIEECEKDNKISTIEPQIRACAFLDNVAKFSKLLSDDSFPVIHFTRDAISNNFVRYCDPLINKGYISPQKAFEKLWHMIETGNMVFNISVFEFALKHKVDFSVSEAFKKFSISSNTLENYDAGQSKEVIFIKPFLELAKFSKNELVIEAFYNELINKAGKSLETAIKNASKDNVVYEAHSPATTYGIINSIKLIFEKTLFLSSSLPEKYKNETYKNFLLLIKNSIHTYPSYDLSRQTALLSCLGKVVGEVISSMKKENILDAITLETLSEFNTYINWRNFACNAPNDKIQEEDFCFFRNTVDFIVSCLDKNKIHINENIELLIKSIDKTHKASHCAFVNFFLDFIFSVFPSIRKMQCFDINRLEDRLRALFFNNQRPSENKESSAASHNLNTPPVPTPTAATCTTTPQLTATYATVTVMKSEGPSLL